MCAIAGILNFDPQRPVDREVLICMRDSMVHRGPDDEGVYLSGHIGLAARRLSIIDLETGNQPVHNEDRTVWVVLNGEIYNFRTLKRDLETRGHRFHTLTDTEVLVHAYEEFGVDFLQSLKGMFAFALWDEKQRILVLARDRMGEKPLHYYANDEELVFGSELKSLFHHPTVPREMDPQALARYLKFQFVPAPQTIYRNVRKLSPGHCMVISPSGAKDLQQRQYWNLPIAAESSRPPAMETVGQELLTVLRTSVKAQLVSDAPVGILMSGGIDSTLIAALASEVQPGIPAFTMAFEEPSYDESKRARLVAQRLGCRHEVELCSEGRVAEHLPAISSLLDEPLGDVSIIPTYLLTRAASRTVKAVLGGDGGDELFAGYPTFNALYFRSAYQRLPESIRRAIAKGVERLPSSSGYLSLDFKLKQFLRGVDGTAQSDFFQWMGAFTPSETARLLTREFRERSGASGGVDDFLASSRDSDVLECMDLCARHYLQDGVLVKVDRASMANSLEVRAPFLDPDVVEFSQRCPLEYKLTLTQTKVILRHISRSILPGEIVWGSKRGFAPPIGKWLKGALRDFSQDLLGSEKIRREGIFEPAPIQKLLDDHLNNRADNSRPLWTLLAFELWRGRWQCIW